LKNHGSSDKSPVSGYGFALLCITGFAGFFGAYLRIPVLPLLAASLGGGPDQVGLVNASFMLAAGFLSIPAGLLADRIGRRITALAGLIFISTSSLLIAGCNSPLQMAFVYLFFGAGLAAFAPSMMSFVADAAPPGGLARAYGWYTTSVYAAMTVGPAAGGYLAKHLGLRPVFVVSATVVALVWLGAFVCLPRRETHRHGRGAVRSALAECLKSRNLVGTLVVTLGSCFGFGLFITFLPLHAREHGLDPGAIGIVFACQALVNVLSRIPFGRMIDRSSDRRFPVVAGFLLMSAGIALLGVETLPLLAGCAIVIGVGMAVGYTAVGALVAESVRGELRGLAMGMYNSCIYLGMMAGSALMGPVARSHGYPPAFLVGGIVTAVSTASFFRICRGKPDG